MDLFYYLTYVQVVDMRFKIFEVILMSSSSSKVHQVRKVEIYKESKILLDKLEKLYKLLTRI